MHMYCSLCACVLATLGNSQMANDNLLCELRNEPTDRRLNTGNSKKRN